MGIYPIPWNHIRTYGADYGLEADMLHTFIQIVFALDAAFLKGEAAKIDAATGKGKK